MIASANLLHKAIKNSQMKILEGYYHGEMSMKHAKEYVKLLEKLVNKSDGTERVKYEEKDAYDNNYDCCFFTYTKKYLCLFI